VAVEQRSPFSFAPPPAGPDEGAQTLSPKQVAHLIGVRYETVHAWIRKGRLPALKDAHGYRIPLDSVQALVEERSAAAEARQREFHDRLDLLAACWRPPRNVEQQR
jgi:excisionase family DNA binding protein